MAIGRPLEPSLTMMLVCAGADYEELLAIAGDKSRVFNVQNFDKLREIVDSVKKTTCKGTRHVAPSRWRVRFVGAFDLWARSICGRVRFVC